VLVRVVVRARAVGDLAARVAAFDLDRGMSDVEVLAQPRLQVADDVLGFAQRAVLEHHMHTERRLL